MLRYVLFVIVAAAASYGSWSLIEPKYAADAFASEETQKSLEVTEAQYAELLASRKKADLITYAIIGAFVGLAAGAFGNGLAPAFSIVGAVAGILLGAVGGVIGSFAAHLFDVSIQFPAADPMVYWYGRWAVIFVAIGLAAAAGTAIAKEPGKQIGPALTGGLLGALAAAMIYCLLSGVITEIENHQDIYPGHSLNRILAIASVMVCVGAGILLSTRAKVAEGASEVDA